MKSLRILVVEDDRLVGELLAEVLIALGHRVCGVQTTRVGAIEAAAADRPDLLIVDVNLADGSGISAVASIVADRRVPHLFISGRPVPPAQLDAELLLKPFRIPELAQAIERALQPDVPA